MVLFHECTTDNNNELNVYVIYLNMEFLYFQYNYKMKVKGLLRRGVFGQELIF